MFKKWLNSRDVISATVLVVIFMIVICDGLKCHDKLSIIDGGDYHLFGSSIAISNNLVAIGAYFNSPGKVYIFRQDIISGEWNQTAELNADDGESSDYFGRSVGIWNNVVIVGSPGDDTSSGSAYIFEEDSSANVWSQTAKLTHTDGATWDYFGRSVAISGSIAAIGVYGDDEVGSSSGSVFIFEQNQLTGEWDQTSILTANDGGVSDNFGYSIDIWNNSIISSAYRDDNQGSAYIFERDSTTGLWTQISKLTATDGSEDDYFGWSVAITDNMAIIGARGDDDSGSLSGSAYIFEQDSGTGVWEQKAKLTASDGATDDNFGYSVGISDNGIAVVGAPYNVHKGVESGSAYIFEKDSATAEWTQIMKLSSNDGADDDNFGMAVAIQDSLIIAGAPKDDGNNENTGSVYIFDLNNIYNISVEFENGISNILSNDISMYAYCDTSEANTNNDTICSNGTVKSLSVMTTSCIKVNISMCNDSYATLYLNSNQNSIVDDSYYTINVDETVVKVVDFYDVFTDHIICPMENHISFCVYTSTFCINNENLLTSNYDSLIVKSFQSMVNVGFYFGKQATVTEIGCAAAYSCLRVNFTLNQGLDFDCGGAFACAESFFASENGHVKCYGFLSCNSITTSTMTEIDLYVSHLF